MRFAAEIVAAGFLAWICVGLAVTSFLFRRNRCHRSRLISIIGLRPIPACRSSACPPTF
jgi:hypothetical protein